MCLSTSDELQEDIGVRTEQDIRFPFEGRNDMGRSEDRIDMNRFSICMRLLWEAIWKSERKIQRGKSVELGFLVLLRYSPILRLDLMGVCFCR